MNVAANNSTHEPFAIFASEDDSVAAADSIGAPETSAETSTRTLLLAGADELEDLEADLETLWAAMHGLSEQHLPSTLRRIQTRLRSCRQMIEAIGKATP